MAQGQRTSVQTQRCQQRMLPAVAPFRSLLQLNAMQQTRKRMLPEQALWVARMPP